MVKHHPYAVMSLLGCAESEIIVTKAIFPLSPYAPPRGPDGRGLLEGLFLPVQETWEPYLFLLSYSTVRLDEGLPNRLSMQTFPCQVWEPLISWGGYLPPASSQWGKLQPSNNDVMPQSDITQQHSSHWVELYGFFTIEFYSMTRASIAISLMQ